ncbi:MAG: hypothetical protein ACXVB0_04580 [Mucilaginibacter sp.]
MKKIIAIALLVLLLFNTGGYMLLFQYVIYQSDHSISQRINNNHYKSTELIEVKIPVHLNIQDWGEYEPISGQVQLKDNCYNYAELKMTRDTLYLMCIPNHEKTRLVNANIIYAKQVSDIPLNKKSHVPLTKKSISENEYNYTVIQYQAAVTVDASTALPDYTASNITKPFIGIPCQPPEAGTSLS